MTTWTIIFYMVLAATIVSYAVLMNYNKDRKESTEPKEPDETKKSN